MPTLAQGYLLEVWAVDMALIKTDHLLPVEERTAGEYDNLLCLYMHNKWGPGQGPKRIREAYRRPAAPLLWKSAKLRPPGVKTILTTQSEKRRTRENPCYLGL